MDLSFEQRLLRFLAREEEGERKSYRDLHALSVEDRVLEGECIMDATCVAADGAGFTLRVAENLSKFRAGDAVCVGDGLDLDAAVPLVYESFDANSHALRLGFDPFARGEACELRLGGHYCVDRRPLGLRGRLQECVREAFRVPAIREALLGSSPPGRDAQRFARAEKALAARGLNPAQVRAGAAAIATESLALVQGPPGTGKTALLAEVLALLCGAGCRIALSAFTHRAVDNALRMLRKVDPGLALIKLGGGEPDPELAAAGVRFLRPKGCRLPERGVVVAATCFQLAKLPPDTSFHYAVFDEAGQLPIPHALAGMLLSRRWLFFGDHAQLPPVITADHGDAEVTASVFEHLHARYGSELLDLSYRMNDGICGLVSALFYADRLRPEPLAATRRLPFVPGGALDEVLDPAHPVVLARIDHLQPGQRAIEEANLAADLVAELVRRHGVAQEQIAVVAPFRAQLRAIRTALQKKGVPRDDAVVVDTVERIQGQERDVVILSLTAGDPDSLAHRAAFFYSTNRLNVALSRARTKVVVIGSASAFAALPQDLPSLRAATVFRRLYRRVPQVDLTRVYS